MNLSIVRQIKTSESTIGEWWLEGKKLDNLYSLEDCDRGLASTDDIVKIRAVKIQNETAIPTTSGIPYVITLTKSKRFTKQMGFDMYMLEITPVKGFDGIRIHWGNKSVDTDGCPLVGSSKSANFIGASREAYKRLLLILAPVLGFKVTMKGTLPVINPIKGFVQKEAVYLIVVTNYNL